MPLRFRESSGRRSSLGLLLWSCYLARNWFNALNQFSMWCVFAIFPSLMV
jgi:hypothetical protein